MSESQREVSESLLRRIEAAIDDASARRSLIEADWPECHRKNCGYRHGDADTAFANMKAQIFRSVRDELLYEMTTRPDMSEEGDTPEQAAVYALAILMDRYNVHRTSTFVNAAQLMVDAYPKLIDALTDNAQEIPA